MILQNLTKKLHIQRAYRAYCIISIVFACFSSLFADTWKAGIAKEKITPKDSVWMAGYASREHSADSILQDLWVKALALEDAEGKQALMITTDLLGLPKSLSDRVCEQLQRHLDLKRDQIMLTSSHTHTGPVLENSLYPAYPLNRERIILIEVYSQWLENRMVAVGMAAFKELKPAIVSSGSGFVRFGVNRRNNVEKELATYTTLDGPIDHSVPVITVQNMDSSYRGIVFGYACHATVLNSYEWSGDYPGFAQEAVEKAFPGATAMFVAGAGGDINPLPRRTVGLAKQYGQELAAAVQRVVTDTMLPLASKLSTNYETIELRYAKIPSKRRLKKIIADEDSRSYEVRWAEDLLKKFIADKQFPEIYPAYPFQSWRLGSQTLIAMGGEVCVEYAIRLKRLLGQETFVFAYANDVMGYIPSLRILKEGGYEGLHSMRIYNHPGIWAREIEEKIVMAIWQQVQQLHPPVEHPSLEEPPSAKE